MPSRAIRSFDYDAERHELTITFERGRTYVYSLVPAAVAVAFLAAPSKGAFHNIRIRDRYPYRRLKTTSASVPLRDALVASTGEHAVGEAPKLGPERKRG